MKSAALRRSHPPPDDEIRENLDSLVHLRAKLDISLENLRRTIRLTEELLAELVGSALPSSYRDSHR